MSMRIYHQIKLRTKVLKHFVDRIIHFSKLCFNDRNEQQPVFTCVRRFSEIWIVKKKFTKCLPTLSLPVTIVVESDYHGVRPIMQITALPLNCIRYATLMSDFPSSTNRERAQITRSIGPRLFCCSRGQFFISRDVKKSFFLNKKHSLKKRIIKTCYLKKKKK